MREFAKLRIDRANARMNAREERCASAPDAGRSGGPPARARRQHGDHAPPRMKKIADAADPLYKTLDDGQKRRLAVLTRMERRFGGEGWRQHRFERGMDRGFERDRGRGPRLRPRPLRPDGGRSEGGPERL